MLCCFLIACKCVDQKFCEFSFRIGNYKKTEGLDNDHLLQFLGHHNQFCPPIALTTRSLIFKYNNETFGITGHFSPVDGATVLQMIKQH